MPCMCGDYYCWSCGPAQGNHRCPVCGVWTADGGCADPEKCAAEAQKMNEAEVREEAEAAKKWQEYVEFLDFVKIRIREENDKLAERTRIHRQKEAGPELFAALQAALPFITLEPLRKQAEDALHKARTGE